MRILPGARDELAFRRARSLRRLMAPAERRLWGALRNGAPIGAKVKRQVPCGAFILDLVFVASRLVIELDGFSHDSAGGVAKDAQLGGWLAAQSFRVLRFADRDALDDLEGVATAISAALDRPHPGPLP